MSRIFIQIDLGMSFLKFPIIDFAYLHFFITVTAASHSESGKNFVCEDNRFLLLKGKSEILYQVNNKTIQKKNSL